MIISVEKARALIDFDGWTDEKVEMKLKAVEQTIRAYTNNKFQDRGYRVTASIRDGVIATDCPVPFSVGDVVEIGESEINDGLYTVDAVDDKEFFVVEDVRDEDSVLITKIVYPADVVDCCVNLLEWEKQNRAKVGIQSETLSRHSVTYFNMGAADQVMGYPAALLGCLKAYRKARF